MTFKLNDTLIDTENFSAENVRQALGNTEGNNEIVDFLERWCNKSATITLKTSGSTGTPKVIEAQKTHMLASAKRTCSFFGLETKSVMLLCLPATYIAGQMMIVRAMVSGANLLVVSPRGNIVDQINQPIDFAAMVPNQVLKNLTSAQKFNQIKTLIIGGGKVGYNIVNQLSEITTTCYETFGMTETLSHIAVRKIWPNVQPNFVAFDGVLVSATNNNNLVISDNSLNISQMQTNDIVRIISATEFEWLGRTDFVINSGGIKTSPESIEQILEPLIGKQLCITSKPDEKLGNRIVLVVEGEKTNITTQLNILEQKVSRYSVPKEVIWINQLPRNKNGKLDRLALRDMIK